MGDELGVLEQLRAKGIQPINIEKGVQHFLELLASSFHGNAIVAGRYGQSSTLQSWIPKHANTRLINGLELYYPGQELISNIRLTPGEDLYLKDHKINDVRVMPTVIWMELMTQTASIILNKKRGPWIFETLELKRPAFIPEEGLEIQLQVFKKDNILAFNIVNKLQPHLSYIEAKMPIKTKSWAPIYPALPQKLKSFNANTTLYNPLLFHKGRFCCVQELLYTSPYEVYASVLPSNQEWFSNKNSTAILTGNPEINDAMLHLVQACVPHFKLLPVAIKSAWLSGKRMLSENSLLFIHAKEVVRQDDLFIYNISFFDVQENLIAQYQKVSFRIVKEKEDFRKMTAFSMEIALKRLLAETHFPGIDFSFNSAENDIELHRPDGKPLAKEEGVFISKSSCKELKLIAKSSSQLGCDIEAFQFKTKQQWEKLLGATDFKLAEESSLDLNDIGTRLWSIRESLRKAGEITPTQLKLKPSEQPNVLLFETDRYLIFSWAVKGIENQKLVFSFCLSKKSKNKTFVYSHTVGFEETNLVGNVYFANYTRWQGKCREAFLHQNVMKISNKKRVLEPITKFLSDGRLALVTCSTDCKFLRELLAFDEVKIYLRLEYIIGNRIGMSFSYRKVTETGEILVAEGNQEVACMERTRDGGIQNYHGTIPPEFKKALLPYIQEKNYSG